jgi:hypothetical protein
MAQTQEEAKSPLPPDAPGSAKDAAAGKEVDNRGEVTALDWVLGSTAPQVYKVEAKVDVNGDLKPLVFVIKQLDPDTIRKAERAATSGDTPFSAQVDDHRLNTDLVFAALVQLKDGESGKTIEPVDLIGKREDPDYDPDPKSALGKAFRYQPGVLDGVASEIRRIAGYEANRVGSAERAVQDAVGN